MLSDAAISCGPDQAPGPTQSSRAVRPSPCHRRDLRGYLWPLSYTNQTGGQPAGTCFGSPPLSGQPFPFTYPSPPRLGANPGRQPQACGTRTRRCLRTAGHFTPMWGPPTCHFSHGPGFRSLQTLSSVQPELHFYSPGLPRFVSALPTLHRHSALPALSKYYCVILRRRSPYCALAYAYPLVGIAGLSGLVARDSKAAHLPGTIIHQATDYIPAECNGSVSLRSATCYGRR